MAHGHRNTHSRKHSARYIGNQRQTQQSDGNLPDSRNLTDSQFSNPEKSKNDNLAQHAQDHLRYDAYKNTGCDSAEKKYRKIEEHAKIFNKGSCHKQLP